MKKSAKKSAKKTEIIKEKKESQQYDKIFKENMEELIIPFAEKLLNISPENLREITENLQTTVERKPDFLKRVVSDSTSKDKKYKKKDYILHIEFQTADEPKMAFRMNEYYAILLRKHGLDVHQIVFFIGEGKAKMKRDIQRKNLSFSFEVINIQDFSYRLFIDSDKPEEIILAILVDFENESDETVIEIILRKIKSLQIDNSIQKKTVIQLEVLSNLRELQTKIIDQLHIMALTYDIEKDLRYQQGEAKGEAKGEIKRATETILEMLKDNFPVEKIAKYAKVSKEYVEEIAKELRS